MHPYLKRVLTILRLRNPSYLNAYFIDETGTLTHAKVEYGNNLFDIKIGDEIGTYIVDKDMILYERKNKKATSFYYVNNPNPINLKHTQPSDDSMTSKNLKHVLESKVVTDLFAPSGMGTIGILILITSAVGVLTLLILLNDLGVLSLTAQ